MTAVERRPIKREPICDMFEWGVVKVTTRQRPGGREGGEMDALNGAPPRLGASPEYCVLSPGPLFVLTEHLVYPEIHEAHHWTLRRALPRADSWLVAIRRK